MNHPVRLRCALLSLLNALCKFFGCGVGDLLEYVEAEPGETEGTVNYQL